MLTGDRWCCLSDPAEGHSSRLECCAEVSLSSKSQPPGQACCGFSLKSFWPLQVVLSEPQGVTLFNNPLWGFPLELVIDLSEPQ